MAPLENEIFWFKRVLNFRMLQSYNKNEWPEKIKDLPGDEQEKLLAATQITDLQPPDVTGDKSSYGWLVNNYELNGWERIALVLALVPSVDPKILDVFFQKNQSTGMPVTEYGGAKTSGHKGFLPTGETLMFLAAGNDYELRFALLEMFSNDHKFRKANILSLESPAKDEPELSGALVASREIMDFIMRGQVRPPEYSNDFPAKRITTEMDWNDLVLSPSTKRQVEEVKIWLRNREKLSADLGMSKRLRPGYKVLFHGSPGTGKTLTACLFGKYTGKDVFRIDLSMIVSKYIGETEKNLAKIFDKADHSDWILFFDEADALFGSRTKVSSSHDRYANQEVSYLLQRIEDYKGIVILASNMKGNIDDAFMRRFNSSVHFPFPKPEERQLLWQKAFPEKLSLSDEVDLKKLSDKYEMSGANITNVVAWCSLMALENGDYLVTDSMLREGMAKELAKEGRTI
jgi:AAA+ superfamily predicted ATPase